MTPAELAPRARAEIRDATRWIAQENPEAARGFTAAVAAAAELIGRNPLVGHRRLDLAPAPFRFLALRGYPYLLVYNERRRPPLIDRIVHGARDLPEILKDLR
jgi:toxin ParE1/3/4